MSFNYFILFYFNYFINKVKRRKHKLKGKKKIRERGEVLPITGGEAVELVGGGDNEKPDRCVAENRKLTSFLNETVASFAEGNLSATVFLDSLDF